jgi:hypothetical protein
VMVMMLWFSDLWIFERTGWFAWSHLIPIHTHRPSLPSLPSLSELIPASHTNGNAIVGICPVTVTCRQFGSYHSSKSNRLKPEHLTPVQDQHGSTNSTKSGFDPREMLSSVLFGFMSRQWRHWCVTEGIGKPFSLAHFWMLSQMLSIVL